MTELYLYQTVHLAAGRPRLAGAHAALLAEASRALFGVDYDPDIRELEGRIAAVARKERYPQGVSGFVRIELTAAGEERLLPAGVSLYAGYALRSLTPDAAIVRYDNPLSDAPTSARETAAALASRLARTEGAEVALRCDSRGRCLTADDAPLFAVRDNAVFTATEPQSVERELTLHAARAAGLEIRVEPPAAEELARFDELFYADHRGITALAHCAGNPYMSLIAERIARAMEALFENRG